MHIEIEELDSDDDSVKDVLKEHRARLEQEKQSRMVEIVTQRVRMREMKEREVAKSRRLLQRRHQLDFAEMDH